jgi:hypothetical protein
VTPQWEVVTETRGYPTEVTERLNVPGGWLYRTVTTSGTDLQDAIAMVFVPRRWWGWFA